MKYPIDTSPQISLMLTEFFVKAAVRPKGLFLVANSVKLQRGSILLVGFKMAQSQKATTQNDMNERHIPSSSKLHHALAKPLAFLHVPWVFF